MVISFDSHSVTLFALFCVLGSQGSGFPEVDDDPSSSSPRNNDALFTSVFSRMLSQMSAKEFLESLIGNTARTRRHIDGLFTSEYSKMLGQLSARAYLESLIGNEPISARHTDGLFTSEYSKMLGQLSTRAFLESLIGGYEATRMNARGLGRGVVRSDHVR
ncbi:VIP peptides-like [Amblyraja radiata]|uniref:VIP peptides-like n=1 Tax=Amblyraja radiata TaxID=386614 RepID=UPI0014029EAF|nr:VIP peptides-like [Amblyraja radiata]